MRKPAVFIVIALFFFGCSQSPFYHTAINNSTETVTVSFYSGNEEITLLPGETVEFELEKGTGGKFGIRSYSPQKTVFAKYSPTYGICVFSDRQAYEVKILNLSGQAGTLQADGDWMDPIDFDDTVEQTDPGWLIYTVNPFFTATADETGYKLLTLIEKDGDTFIVIIR